MKSPELIREIESLSKEKNLKYIDAVVLWCELNNIEIELIAAHLKKDSVFKAKLQLEGEDLNILKKGARLPVE